jgi:AcrR family transcriptional regulator
MDIFDKMSMRSVQIKNGVFSLQESSLRLKEDIVRCAVDLFKAEGYSNVSVNEICEEAHVSRSVFYTVFKGKRSILDYVISKPQQTNEEEFRKFADAANDFERIWLLFDRFITIALYFGPKLTSTLFIMQFESPEGIREAVHALDNLFATLAKNCARSGIIETEEPPELLAKIATDLICHELYVWCSQDGNFSLRERARQYSEVAFHVKPQYRMTPAQRAAL